MLRFAGKGDIMKIRVMHLLELQRMKSMQIKKIKIGGFRNITEVSISFEAITALVGLNGYGKSNIMDAIDFGFDFLHNPNQIKSVMMSSKSRIPLLRANAGKDYEFGINLMLESAGKSYYVDYSYSFAWETNQSPAKIKSETLKIKLDSSGQKYNTYIQRDEKSAQYKPSASGRCSKTISIENNALLINKLLALDDLFFLDIVKQVNSVQFFIERHLDASSSFEPAPFVIKGFQELELQGIQSIPRAIFFLKRDYSDKYELLVNAFRQMFPNVLDINVQEITLNQEPAGIKISEDAPFIFTDNVYSMSIIDDRLIQPIGFETLSDGTKRIFLMLTYAIIADIKNLSMIAIEEPENSIHPSLFQSYLDVLMQLVNNCKIVITSHSPYVIQYLDPNCIYIGMTNTTGEANFRKIATSKISRLMKDASTYSNSLGDYIFDLISSDDANESLEEYMEDDNG